MMGRQNVDPFAAILLKGLTEQTGQRQRHKQGQAMVVAGGRQTESGYRQGSGQAAKQSQSRK